LLNYSKLFWVHFLCGHSVDMYSTESVTLGQCNVRCRLWHPKLYCWVTKNNLLSVV